MPTVQLVVEYADHQRRYYPADRGWRIDAASRCIVIGRDLPRTYVPLDGVTDFTIEHIAGATPTEATQPGHDCCYHVAAARNVLADRERELLDLKGPCSNTRCRLHYAHSGPCDTTN